MSLFKSVNHSDLQKAFALAHKAQHDPQHDSAARARFRAIAYLIWRSCGEDRPYQGKFPADIERQLAAAENLAETEVVGL